jgi:hypothetical protein
MHLSPVNRSYFSGSAAALSRQSDNELFGRLASKLPFAVEPTQSAAWKYQIAHLRELIRELPDAHFFFEFLIPRMGRRADLIVLQAGIILVVEYKLGARHFDRSSLEQVYSYGLDLNHFHETSHTRSIVPMLVAMQADSAAEQPMVWDDDSLAQPLRLTPSELAPAINHCSRVRGAEGLYPEVWEAGLYRPTPTIVEAAQALYRGHDVAEISRSEAGAENLTRTADYVSNAIERAKRERRKIICFITGVPGSRKTLAGLNLATARQRAHSEEHAVFLSGNGPLVENLRQALAADAVARAKAAGQSTSKVREHRQASAFIQNIHHFRDDALASLTAPVEKVAVFDEAQRAWMSSRLPSSCSRRRGSSASRCPKRRGRSPALIWCSQAAC